MTDQSKHGNIEDQWLEFVVGNMCSLCGQAGILDTRGIRTPAGFECGGFHYCICPNGRALKARNAPKLEWLAQARSGKSQNPTDQSKQWIITEQGMKEAAAEIMSVWRGNVMPFNETSMVRIIAANCGGDNFPAIAAHSEAASPPADYEAELRHAVLCMNRSCKKCTEIAKRFAAKRV